MKRIAIYALVVGLIFPFTQGQEISWLPRENAFSSLPDGGGCTGPACRGPWRPDKLLDGRRLLFASQHL